MKKKAFVLAVAVIMLAASPVSAEILYNLTDLGEGAAYGINNSGQVVGTSGNRPVLFGSTGGGSNTYLGDEGIAYSINNSGQIVGYSGDQATLFDPTGQGGNIYMGQGVAYSINDNGHSVGYAYGRKAVIFDTNGTGENTVLADIGIGGSEAWSINNSGQIVGWGYIPLHPFGAMSFDPDSEDNNTFLAPLMVDGQWVFSLACSINNNGQIVGYVGAQATIYIINPVPVSDFVENSSDSVQMDFPVASAPGGGLPPVIDPNAFIPIPVDPNDIVWPPAIVSHPRATLFDPTGDDNNVDLGTLPGDGHSNAYSINNKGQIVGYGYTSQDEKHAALFDPTGGGDNVDLNELIDPTLGWTLTEARCVNDNGWIVGQMTDDAGEEHAFLLTPTPRKIAIDSIEDAIAEKLEALERINAALEKEWAAADALDEMLASKEFGDLSRRRVFIAKLRIYVSMYDQMASKAQLRRSIRNLKRSLRSLGWEPPDEEPAQE